MTAPFDNEPNPFDPVAPAPHGEAVEAALVEPARTGGYRPWSRGRVWVLFFFGMHAAGCMTFFFHPFFSLLGFAFGLPAVILSGMEIREFPEARNAGPVRWGRVTGFIGLIGGPIAFVIFGAIIAAVLSVM